MYIAFKVVDTLVSILLFFVNHAQGFKSKFVNQLRQLKRGLSEEKNETKDMLRIYRRYMNADASKEELAFANKQLRDLMKTMGLGILLVLPFSFLTLPVLVKLGEKLGISLLPSAFSKDRDTFTNQDKL